MLLPLTMLTTAHAATGDFSGGDGKTAETAYQISSLKDLETLASYVNEGKASGKEYFRLTGDIDMSEKYHDGGDSWTPIGTSSKSFFGIFDGENHTISGLYINRTAAAGFQGLFGYIITTTVSGVPVNGTVRNLNVKGEVTSKGSYVGGIVGALMNGCILDNCSFTGNVYGTSGDYVGGIVGRNFSGTVQNCYFSGSIKGNGVYVGGIAGENSNKGIVQYCYNTGSVVGAVDETGVGAYVGGIVGYNNTSTVTNCYNTGSVTGETSVNYVGGIAGGNGANKVTGTLSNCYNIGPVTCRSSIYGGISGQNYDKLENNYYLTGIVNNGNGGVNKKDTDGAQVKTEERFNSGEVMWLLQHGQENQVWGQWLSGTGHEIEKYPVLTTQLPKRVWKVTFVKGGKELKTVYLNDSNKVSAPTDDEWYDSDGTLFNADAPITKDRTFGLRVLFGGTTGNEITTVYGRQAEKNLDEWMGYENGSPVQDKFTYTIIDDGGITQAFIDGNILTIPDNVNVREGGYTLQIRAHEKAPLVDTAVSYIAVTDFGKQDVILTVQVIIDKAVQEPFTITDLPNSVTYEDAPFKLNTEGGSGDGEVTWAVTDGGNFAEIDRYGTVTIKGAGDVIVTAVKSGGVNYNDITATFSFTVHKANQEEFTIKDLPASVAYGDEFRLSAVTGSGDGAITWEVTDGKSLATIDNDGNVTIIGVGEVTITATKAGGANYYDASDVIVFTAHKANQSAFTIKSVPSGVGYGDKFQLETEGGLTGGTVSWAVTAGTEYAEIDQNGNVEIIGVGSVTITATKSGGDYYYDISDEITLTVHKANQSAFTIKSVPSSVGYGDKFQLETEGGLTGGTVSWTVTTGTEYAEIDQYGNVTIKGVGNVTVKATKSGGDNYYDISDEITFTVHKANQSTLTIEGLPQVITYGDPDFTLTVTGGWDGGSLSWTVTEGIGLVTVDGGKVTIKGAGNVTITVTKSGGDNYFDISDIVSFTVHKANQSSLTIEGLPEEIANGNSFKLTATGGSGTGEITWEVTDGNEDATIDPKTGDVNITGAGSITITATKGEDDNYYSTVAIISFRAGKGNQAALTIKGLPSVVVYGGNSFTLTAEGGSSLGEITWAVTDGIGLVTVTGGQVTILGAGDVTITATKSGGEDYNDISAIVSFTVQKANQSALTIEGLPSAVAYGEEFRLTATGGLENAIVTWEVSGESQAYAEISENGYVTIKGVGKVTITATKLGGDNYYDISTIVSFTVNKANQSALTIEGLPSAAAYGDEFTLTCSGGAGTGGITWEVSADSKNYAEISLNGYVTIKGVGKVTITATKAGDANYNDISATISFTTVKANQPSLTIEGLSSAVVFGDKFSLTANGGRQDGTVSWNITSGQQYATIDRDGNVEIIGVGSVTITATVEGGDNYNDIFTTISFTTQQANQSALTIVGLPKSVTFGDSGFKLQTTGGWKDGTVTWEVIDGDACVTIDPDGNVTIIGACDYVAIRATKSGGDNYYDISTVINFKVAKANQSHLTINGLPANVIYGDKDFTLGTDGGDGNGAVKWTVVEGANCVTVDRNGTVKIIGAGKVTITATKSGGDNYYDISAVISFTVAKATPNYTIPDGLIATYGDTLASVVLPQGWVWDDGTLSVGVVGVHGFSATFVPGAAENYNVVTLILSVSVQKATPKYTVPSGLTATCGDTLADVALPNGWTWNDELTTLVGEAGERTFSATFTPEDTDNYTTVTVELKITVTAAEDNKPANTFSWWWIILIVLAVVLIVLFIIFIITRRRKDDSEQSQK